MVRIADAIEIMRPARDTRVAAEDEATLSIGEWCDRNLMVPRGDGPVPYQQALTPYWSYPLRLVRDRILGTGEGAAVEIITIITATQVGKTFGCLVPTLAWIIAIHPRDCAVILPSESTVKKFFKAKLTPCFEKSPRLSSLLPVGLGERAKRLGAKAWILDRCTTYAKNGSIALDLRSDDVPIMLWDELDALPPNINNEGSPLSLATDRQKTFPHHRLQLRVTTPTDVHHLGWAQLNSATHERLVVTCLGCGAHHWLDPDRLKLSTTGLSLDDVEKQDAVRWHCPTCDRGHTTDERDQMVTAASAVVGFDPAAGGWVQGQWELTSDDKHRWIPAATVDATTGRYSQVIPTTAIRRSLWLNALYSRFISCGHFYAAGERARAGRPAEWQSFVNGYRAEPFTPLTDSARSEHVTAVEAKDLSNYQLGQIPVECAKVILTCDQQGIQQDTSWFPWVARGWQNDGSSFLLDAGIAANWQELDALTTRAWSVGGLARKADISAIDTANGTMIRHIRQWCRKDVTHRLSISGSGTMSPDTPWSEIRLTAKNQHKLYGLPVVWYFNANLFRDDLFDRLRGAPGMPAWRIPTDATEQYRNSLTAEERIPQHFLARGRPIQRMVWVPRTYVDAKGEQHTRHDNHLWDCEVMQIALVTIKGWLKLRTPTTSSTPAGQIATGWMDGYQ